METPVLEARALSKRYGAVVALAELSLRVGRGEILALLGANGAGKTTTTQLFLGFIAPSSGQALIEGLDVATHALESKRHLAYIPERLALYPHLSGLENLAYFQALGGAPRPEGALRAFLVEAGLPAEAADRPASTYSKGMLQKVGIALALAKSARALLLDEPLSGLDPKAANDFCALLRALRDRGAAVLMATHDLFRAKDTADRIGIMRSGKLVAEVETARVTHAELEALYLEQMRG
jgi:ABC-2 type transport system ATP-binding protein